MIWRTVVSVLALALFASLLFPPGIIPGLGLTRGEAAILAWVLVVAVEVHGRNG